MPALLSAVLLALCMLSAPLRAEDELVFLNWSEYVDPQLLREFERQQQVRVKEVFYESEDALSELLLTTQATGFDVVLVPGKAIGSYAKRGWLSPLTAAETPNLKDMRERWLKAFGGAAEGWGMPYLWGTLGIAFRSDLLDASVTRWLQLYRPAEALRGKIMMLGDAREVVGLGLKALGYSYNSGEAAALDQVENLLLAQKPWVNNYEYTTLTADAKLVTGEVWMGMMYNGDALALKELKPEIAFVVPEEGTALWCDYLTILASSPRKPLAQAFVNFLAAPENAARLAQFTRFATPSQAAETLLPAEFLENPFIYPSQAILDKSEFAEAQPPQVRKRWNAIHAKLVK